jgi:predicted HicB family RNase H-like nuclease
VNLNKRPDKRAGGRMIHVRLDENTHRELKILAAKTDQTVQGIVENLIKQKVDNARDPHGKIDKEKGQR